MSAVGQKPDCVQSIAEAAVSQVRRWHKQKPEGANEPWGCYRLGWNDDPQGPTGWIEWGVSRFHEGYENDLVLAFHECGVSPDWNLWGNRLVISWIIEDLSEPEFDTYRQPALMKA